MVSKNKEVKVDLDSIKLERFTFSAKKKIITPEKIILKKNLQAGKIVIVLCGKFRGKRVVFLKQCSSGLILCTGPYCVNGVPLIRLNQKHVIVTSTSINVEQYLEALSDKVNDSLFFAQKEEDEVKSEEKFFEKKKPKRELSKEYVEIQKDLDAKLLVEIEKVKYLKEYLKEYFSLRTNMRPHLMKF
eukprot:NODE_4653_length_639_cov_2.237288_g3994_i0.p1 GENE.NODE_4653_length_639_cov_2.237288_g3994_i0~~NODE_4653_length_639_cov_2.237288_g3994_i0.p1  ORF type:complete len:207 (+),score=18.77 NODE_4653_length_639_cov_2.237288_g3994_i0:62-622(+)